MDGCGRGMAEFLSCLVFSNIVFSSLVLYFLVVSCLSPLLLSSLLFSCKESDVKKVTEPEEKGKEEKVGGIERRREGTWRGKHSGDTYFHGRGRQIRY